ncbi:mannose-binding protein C-like [Parambassis ranga]|uniref:Mannose-binding protein C-like n=1 Tax=Parambassis ranga TaxID=210632 RepID=A0A6P7IDD4_9TELE|nr:mannose-binding protein C-like [Parambassis ranga]
MEGSLKKLLLLATVFIMKDVTYQSVSRRYILITHQEMSWSEARSYCRTFYSDLATIATERDFNEVASLPQNTTFWIGLYDDVNSWDWSLVGELFNPPGDKRYRRWQEGQPDNARSAQHCVALSKSGTWTDESCSTAITYPLCYGVRTKQRLEF